MKKMNLSNSLIFEKFINIKDESEFSEEEYFQKCVLRIFFWREKALFAVFNLF